MFLLVTINILYCSVFNGSVPKWSHINLLSNYNIGVEND
jgi:hypothetical protein